VTTQIREDCGSTECVGFGKGTEQEDPGYIAGLAARDLSEKLEKAGCSARAAVWAEWAAEQGA
jgi:hypothetical protein